MSVLNIQVLKENAVLIFTILVAFSVVLLGGITYYNYFSFESGSKKSKPKNNNNVSTNIVNNQNTNSNTNTNSNAVSLNNNNVNSLMKNMDSIQKPKVRDSGILSNVADNSYKNFKGKQVFNVSNNIFTYDDARAVCKANGAELATYQQVMDSYKSGAEWCNYGWSDKQMALYPTQKKTWEKLQEDPENANICGEWGVNGGYFENPNTLFGANCYGVKPEPKNRERMGTPPVSEKEQNILSRVARFKEEKDDLTINPFNAVNWSQKI